MILKVVSWNCNQNFKDKYLNLKPNLDIYVIQECERLQESIWQGYASHWCGENSSKGLGVFTKGESKIAKHYNPSKFKYALPIEFKNIKILAVWLFNKRISDDETFESGYFLDVYNYYERWLKESKNRLIIGDFNNSQVWDKEGKKNNWKNINSRLEKSGLVSAYHHKFGENFGEESRGTFYMHKDESKKYHIDYSFNDKNVVSDCVLGDQNYFLKFSDHIPLYATLDLN